MSTPSLTPYTAEVCWHPGGPKTQRFVAEKYYTATRPDGAVIAIETAEDLAACLNDAFVKGVETERARCLKAVMGLSVPQCFSARELIEHDVPPAPQPPITIPWSDLTDSAQHSIRDTYPWSKWTEAELAVHLWTKAGGMTETMCLWRPVSSPTIKP